MGHRARRLPLLARAAMVAVGVVLTACTDAPDDPRRGTVSPSAATTAEMLTLPVPQLEGSVSLEQALAQRRSVREFAAEPLTLAEAGQLLWAAQGVTSATGGRTAPSAGALYPLEVLLVAGDVDGLAAGVHRYLPHEHALLPMSSRDVRADLRAAALDQSAVSAASASLVITGVYERTTGKYGSNRGVRFVHIESGHAAQNVALQAVALGLGTVTIGALEEDAVRDVLGLAEEETPLYVLPVGRPA